jgi:hypothetical protein
MAPLPQYAVLTNHDGLATLDVSSCHEAPAVMNCPVGAVTRSAEFQPCLQLLSQPICTKCPAAKKCMDEINVARMEGREARVVTTPAGSLIRTFREEVRIYAESPHSAPGISGRKVQPSKFGTYWLAHSAYDTFSVGLARYPSQGQSVYVTKVLQPDPFNFSIIADSIEFDSRPNAFAAPYQAQKLSVAINKLEDLREAYQELASQSPITMATVPPLEEDMFDSSHYQVAALTTKALLVVLVVGAIALVAYIMCFRYRRMFKGWGTVLQGETSRWQTAVAALKREFQNLEVSLSTVFERFPFPMFREWYRSNRQDDRILGCLWP